MTFVTCVSKLSFITYVHISISRDIEQYYSTQIDEMPMNGESLYTFYHALLLYDKFLLLCYKESYTHFLAVADLI